MTVTTNYHWREFKTWHDVPPKVLADRFGYLDPKEASEAFICYRGTWYHPSDFNHYPGLFWDGYIADSMSTGVVIRLSRDWERYQIGYYVS